MRRHAVLLAAIVLIGMAGLSSAFAQWWELEKDFKVSIWPVKGNIYLIRGAGANVAASVGRDGVMLVDSGTEQMANDVLAAVKRLQIQINTVPPPTGFAAETRSSITYNSTEPPKPIRYIVNTSFDPEHIGGNAKISGSGTTIAGGNVGGYAPSGAAILAHETVLGRISAIKPPVPDLALPTDVYHLPQYKLSNFFNGEGVLLINAPAGKSDGDTMVYFRGSDVIAAGDIFSNDRYPMIDIEKGGSIQGVLDGLNHLLDLAIPEFRTEGGTMFIPGHGRVCDSADLGYYRDMVTIIRDRIKKMTDKGMTLQQVKASEPTLDYDPRFGSTTGAWTTDRFVEAVYRSLQQERQKKGN
ncbi:MAG TPA: MBL fold metallo-hydrolase [Terriglobia bacterium]|nr:MBL fold metallo-hydrolase [Terriglobia bacterium]